EPASRPRASSGNFHLPKAAKRPGLTQALCVGTVVLGNSGWNLLTLRTDTSNGTHVTADPGWPPGHHLSSAFGYWPRHPNLSRLKITRVAALRFNPGAHNNSFKPTPLRGAA